MIRIYTDGSHYDKIGAYAAVIITYDKDDGISHIKHVVGMAKMKTSSRAELQAVVEGLSELQRKSTVTVYTDDQSIVDVNRLYLDLWARNGWKLKNSKNKIANKDLWMQLHTLIHQHRVTIKWIKGHAGHTYNELAHSLASTLVRAYRKFNKKK